MGIFKNIRSFFNNDLNEQQEGVISEELEELELSMTDEELLELSGTWKTSWESVSGELFEIGKTNENYWSGKQFDDVLYTDGNKPLTDNLIFESVETFVPLATKNNPEPITIAEQDEVAQTLAKKVQKMLIYVSDTQRFKLKLKKLVRYWALYRLGVLKLSWSNKKNDIVIEVIRPQKLILDPDATINDDLEYTGEYLGHYRRNTAASLIKRFPKKKDYITEQVKGKMGTVLQYIEWWTNDYVFWELNKEVLAKAKNPHWNYIQERKEVDEYGIETVQQEDGINHLSNPQMPFIFLSVFNIGKHPYDDTSLIEQSIPMQDLVNKRQRQIDRNNDFLNGGWAISGDSGLDKEGANKVIEEARKGGGIFIPTGNPDAYVKRMIGQPLPADVFNQLADVRNEIRNSFGTRGSSPQGTISEPTVRGKLIVKGQDIDRIGGLISEYIEQVADRFYNYVVQMFYVYYDEVHVGAIIGKEQAQEWFTLRRNEFTKDIKLLISVKEGSLLPKDDLTKANQAVDLQAAGIIDPITTLDQLQFPNPKETAKRALQWKLAPLSLFPDLEKQLQPPMPAEAIEGAPQGLPQGLPTELPQTPDLNQQPIQPI